MADSGKLPEVNGRPRPADNLLEDVAALRTSLKTLNVWGFPFSEHLDGFNEAISFISQANSDHEARICLADAAYVLQNAGQIWAKRVDLLAKFSIQTNELLSDRDQRKNNGEEGDEAGQKKQPRKRSGHPLAMCSDERGEPLLRKILNRRVPTDQCILKEIVQLPQDMYLAEVQPRSLGLMDYEKIHPYLDDRGNKGNDWAEFRINTIKLNEEGYFPLQHLNPEFYDVAVVPIVQLEADDDEWARAEGSVAGSNHNHDHNPGMDIPQDMPHGLDISLGGDGSEYPLVEPQPNNPVPAKQHIASQGRPNRPQILPRVPFKKTFSISALKKDKSLLVPELPDNQDYGHCPFKRRTKRILLKPPTRSISGEVNFFQNFWRISDGDEQPRIYLNKVLRRFHQRLRKVDTPPVRRGRAKLNNLSFESVTPSDCPFITRDIPDLDFLPSSALKQNIPEGDADEFGDAGGPRYEETTLPLGIPDNDTFGPNPNDFQEEMRRGEFYRGGERMDIPHDNNDDGRSSTSSRIVHVDLCDWEHRLNDFLTIHEPTTLSFNLEEFGKNLVVTCRESVGDRDEPQSVRRVVARRTTGEVCRSFLSMLDLANKHVVEFESKKDNEMNISTNSQGVGEMAMRICLGKKMAKLRKPQVEAMEVYEDVGVSDIAD